MATLEDFKHIALSQAGTAETPYFGRIGFKARRVFAVIDRGGVLAYLLLKPDEQEFKCLTAPDVFSPTGKPFGAKGWTTVMLDNLDTDELTAALAMAWSHARPTAPSRSTR